MTQGHYAKWGKRLFDLVLSTTIILVGLIPGTLIAIAIALDSRGGVFYKQERVGRNSRPFWMYKFRSMVSGAEKLGKGALVEKGDFRITRMGKLLRATSLDELPQILNIFRGEMSIIGPRPGLAYQAEQYDDEQRRRLWVPPGVTGWAQVHGRNAIPWSQRIRYDIEYVDRLSFAMDMRILWMTVGVILKRQDQIAAADYWKERRADEASGTKDDGAPGKGGGEERRTG